MRARPNRPMRLRSRRSVIAASGGSMIDALERRVLLSVAEPNNTFSTAVDVTGPGGFGGRATFTDAVNDSDPVDYYKIDAPIIFSNNFTARLSGLSGNLDLALFHDLNNNGIEDAGELSVASTHTGTTEEFLTRGLITALGTYYIKVFSPGAGNSSAYTLELTNDTAGDTIDTARGFFGDDTGTHEYAEGLDNVSDLVDVFSFTLDGSVQAGTFAVRLTAGNVNNYHVDLLVDTNNNKVFDDGIIATSHLVDGEPGIAPMTLQNGHTYYLRVLHSAPATENYTLRTFFDNAGNTVATARVFNTEGFYQVRHEHVGSQNVNTFFDPSDVYQIEFRNPGFNLYAEVDLDAGFSPSASSLKEELFKDANNNGALDAGELLASASTSSTSGSAFLKHAVPPGVYFLRVSGGPSVNYTLQVSGDRVPGLTASSPQFSNSLDIGQLDQQQRQEDGLGAGDTSDTYKFSFARAGNLIASVTDSFSQDPQPLTGTLATDTNHNGVLDPGETIGTFDKTAPLNKNLAAGTYFVTLSSPGHHFGAELLLTPDFAGNTPLTARSLGTLGAFTQATDGVGASRPADVDFYKFSLSSAQTFTGTLDLNSGIDSQASITLTLFKDNGGGSLTQLQTASSSTQFLLLQRALSAGNYQLKVSTTEFYYNYSLGFSTGDNDDSIPEVRLTPNQFEEFPASRDFTLSSGSDVDLIGLFAGFDPGQVIAIDVDSRNGSNVDTFLRVFDSSGHQLASNDNGSAPGETASKFSYLEFHVPAEDEYFVGVSSAGNTSYNPNTGGGDSTGSSSGQCRITLSETQSVSGSIAGTVFNDVNGNGVRDSGEAGLSGRMVWIDLDNDKIKDSSEPATSTDSSGNYKLSNVALGSYVVRQVLPSGWVQTAPSGGFGVHVTLGSGQNLTGRNFGAKQTAIATGSIAGTIFRDGNGNGVKDSGEVGMGGQAVWADLDNDKVRDTNEPRATTDASGNYKITGLAAGSYVIRQIVPAGWQQTLPSGGFGAHATLTSGQNVTGKNFGVRPIAGTASIAGTVFHDFDRDGTRDSTDTGISAWRVYIDTNNNSKLDSGEISVLTDGSGNYKFSGLAAATYKVRQQLQSGFVQTTPANNFGLNVTVASGQNSTGRNFGVDN